MIVWIAVQVVEDRLQQGQGAVLEARGRARQNLHTLQIDLVGWTPNKVSHFNK